jgi:hypothetical protein
MIRVDQAPEPLHFDLRVRTPGLSYISSLPPGSKIDTSERPYWRGILLDLHRAYRGICAYTCHWIPYDVGSDTVEHFIAKSVNPMLSYEWSNFRLACGRLNGRKGAYQDVVDPFKVVSGMFRLHFPSLCVVAGDAVSIRRQSLAGATIARLRLNDNRSILMRQAFVEDYISGDISLTHIRRKAPFLAQELERQTLTKKKLRKIMGQG